MGLDALASTRQMLLVGTPREVCQPVVAGAVCLWQIVAVEQRQARQVAARY